MSRSRSASAIAPGRPARRRGRLVAVAVVVVASLTAGGLTVTSAARGAADYASYHDVSSAEHASASGDLLAQGYRPVSLSVFGSTAAPRYAATWALRPGPAVRVFQDQANPSLTYQRTYPFGTSPTTTSPYRPAPTFYLSLITATTDANGTVFAGAWEASSATPMADLSMSADEFAKANEDARKKGYSIRSAAAYGNTFAATWWPDASRAPWSVDWGLSLADRNAVHNAHQQNQVRPDLISLGSGTSAGRYLSIWRDDRIGYTAVYPSLTKSIYEQTVAKHKAQGLYPVRLQVGIVNGAQQYAAIFAADDRPLARTWTVTSAGDPQVAQGLDDYIQYVMTSKGVRTGALALVKDGKLIASKGYTWAEDGATPTQPATQFRIASCTKPLTAIAIAQLVEQKVLKYGDRVQDVLGLTSPSGAPPADPRFKDITIDHLLTHTAGWDRDITAEPNDADVAAAFGAPLPANSGQLASVIAGRTLDFTPGARQAYSNLGYVLLGRVIEAKVAFSYETTMKYRVFNPLGLGRPAIGGSSRNEKAPDETLYVPGAPWATKSILSASRPWAAGPYGSYNTRTGDSAGGWRMAAPDLARVLAAFDADDNPLFQADDTTVAQMWSKPITTAPTMTRGWFTEKMQDTAGTEHETYTHNGILSGERCLMTRRSDGVSMVVLLGGEADLYPWTQGQALNSNLNDEYYTEWPTTDLFPSVGIPN